MSIEKSRSGHVDCLDGLRGIASLWVVIGHAMKLSGWGFKPFDAPDLAVDLFIVLSGFLMAFHYIRRESREPWGYRSTWAFFWMRRFFRIAPLYYLVLVAALALGPHLGEIRHFIGTAIPGTGTDPTRYIDQSPTNFLLHVSFLFGFLPDYGYRTPIPDWSIGLEMQFYLAFPFLMLFWRRAGPIVAVLFVAGACLALRFGAPLVIDAYAMPTFLPLKLPLFLAGMLAAASFFASGRRFWMLAIAAAVVATAPSWRTDGVLDCAARVCFVAALLGLPAADRFSGQPLVHGLLAFANSILRMKAFRFLGDVSYGVYLIHLLIMIPIVGRVIVFLGPGAGGAEICALSLAATVFIAYPLAWGLHRTVEQWGIGTGRAVVERLQRMRPVFRRRTA